MIRRADDRLLVLDDEQRVALVAQIVHDADQPADIARVQADARLVHDEERVHERRAEAGREIHSLHFAAAQRARGAIEREIAEADFAEITQARARLRRATSAAVESLGGRVRSREEARERRKWRALRPPAGSDAVSGCRFA